MGDLDDNAPMHTPVGRDPSRTPSKATRSSVLSRCEDGGVTKTINATE